MQTEKIFVKSIQKILLQFIENRAKCFMIYDDFYKKASKLETVDFLKKTFSANEFSSKNQLYKCIANHEVLIYRISPAPRSRYYYKGNHKKILEILSEAKNYSYENN
jgi:hypothetical protein